MEMAEGRERGNGGSLVCCFFGTLYAELYVEGARSSWLPAFLPLILSSSRSRSAFRLSVPRSRGAQPLRRPRRLDASSYLQLDTYCNHYYFFKSIFFFRMFARMSVREGSACLLFFA